MTAVAVVLFFDIKNLRQFKNVNAYMKWITLDERVSSEQLPVIHSDIHIPAETELADSRPTTVEERPKQKQNTVTTTTTATMLSIPPSNMEVHYYEMWDHATSTINIPEKYKNPFNAMGVAVPPRTSLKILENVLHGEKYRAEFEAVELYMEVIHNTTTTAAAAETATAKQPTIPKCLAPNLGATRELANRVVKERRKHKRNTNTNKKWPYEKLVLPLPVMNGEDYIYIYIYCSFSVF